MDLKSGLTDYLKKFAESGKVSRKHDSDYIIHEITFYNIKA